MSINFESIKNELVEKGLAHKEMADAATQKVVRIDGEWNRDGSATIKSTSAGWVVGDFAKVVDVKFDVPQTSSFNVDSIKTEMQSQYPGARVIVNIQ